MTISSCGRNLKFYGDFCGRIIDLESNTPVEGVVVIANWQTLNINTPNYGMTRTYKVSEVVSNSKGEFCLKGQGFSFFPYQPSVEIFKSGYACIATSYYPHFKDNPYYKDSISWDGNTAIVKLKKLSIEERDRAISEVGFYINDQIEFKDHRVLLDKEIAAERAVLEPYRERKCQEEYMKNRVVIPWGGGPPASR